MSDDKCPICKGDHSSSSCPIEIESENLAPKQDIRRQLAQANEELATVRNTLKRENKAKCDAEQMVRVLELDKENAEQRAVEAEVVIESLLNGLDSNYNPELLGLGSEEWEKRISKARRWLEGKP